MTNIHGRYNVRYTCGGAYLGIQRTRSTTLKGMLTSHLDSIFVNEDVHAYKYVPNQKYLFSEMITTERILVGR